MQQKPTILDVSNAAEFLRVSQRTIHNWIKKRIIRSHKIGGKRRFILEELIDDVRKHEEVSA